MVSAELGILEDFIQEKSGKLNETYSYLALVGSYENHENAKLSSNLFDIDMVALANPNLKIGEFFIQDTKFKAELKRYLNSAGHDVIPFPKKCYEAEVAYLSGWDLDKDILLHNICFYDQDSFNSLNPPNFKKEMSRNARIFCGNLDNINNMRVNEHPLMYLYMMIQDSNILNSNYNPVLKKMKIEDLAKYVLKWSSKMQSANKNINETQIDELFFECFKSLDDQIIAQA